MLWNVFFVFLLSMWLVISVNGQYHPPAVSPVWGYFTPPVLQQVRNQPRQIAMRAMVDLTNNLGVAILQDHSFSRSNFAFSPYGVASVLVVLYEGARGESAKQIQRAVQFPADKDLIRIGFRDIHRHLRNYFSHEGYLSGISLNKETSSLKPEYKKILRFYGYDVDLNQTLDEEDEYSFENSVSQTTSPTTIYTQSAGTSVLGTTTHTLDKVKNVTDPHELEKEGTIFSTVSTSITQSSTQPPEKKNENLKDTTVLSTVNASITQSSTQSAEKETENLKDTTVLPTMSVSIIQPSTQSAERETENLKDTTVLPAMSVSIQPSTQYAERETENLKDTTVLSTEDASITQPSTQPAERETENLKDKTVLPTGGVSVTQPSTQSAERETENFKDTTVLSTAGTITEDLPQEPTENFGKNETNEISNLETVKTTTFSTITTELSEEKVTITTEFVGADEFQINLTVGNPLNSDDMMEKRNQKAEDYKTESISGAINDAELNEVLNTQSEDHKGSLSSTVTTQEILFEVSVTEAKTVDKRHKRQHCKDEAWPMSVPPVVQATEKNEQIEEITNVAIDNGMLIPQPDEQTSKPVTELHSSVETSSSARMTSPIKAGEEDFEETTESKEQKSLPTNGFQVRVENNIRMSSEKEDEVPLKSIRSLINNKMPLWLRRPKKKFNPRKKRTITDYLKSPYNPDLSLQLQNGMYDTHVSRDAHFYRSLPRLLFLVDGAVDTPVPMMTYTNIFNYAYIPRLHSKALEFPLDDIRYKLLILLPVERRGLRQLIYDLASFPLCNVLESVRPTRVKAMVPTFMVEGFVILTSSLQKLGIWDVFDPRKANLSGMTMDPELYVRNVEQSVTVVIRNYVEILDIQTRTMAARELEEEFEATHPFLYFVLDTDTNVALMAGQILDPLNSRIY